MSTKKTEAGTAAKAVETTNSNNGTRRVSSKASNFGQFGYVVTCELTAEQVETILAEGILHIAQRAPASRVEKTMVGYGKREEMGSEWTRDMIAYSDERARQFEVELAREFQKLTHIAATVSAERYEVDKREPAYAYGKLLVTKATKAGGGAIKRLAANIGYTGEDLTIDNVEFLRAIEDDKRKRDEAMFA